MNRDIYHLRTTIAAELDGATITDEIIPCYLPRPRSAPLRAFDIVDKLQDLEAEFACQILNELIARYPEVQEYLINNYIEILQEEDL